MTLLELMPADTPRYMTHAWVDCLRWAINTEGIVDSFREDTGFAWRPAKDPLGRMIDAATGVEDAFLRAFIMWFNANVWGSMSAPLPEDA